MDKLFDVVKGKHLNKWEEKDEDFEEQEGLLEVEEEDEEKEPEEKKEKIQPSLNRVGDYNYESVQELEPEIDHYEKEFAERKNLLRLQRKIEIIHTKRVQFGLNAILTYLFQMTLVVLIFYELRHNPTYYKVIYCIVERPIMFGRFVCTVILHLSLTDDVSLGLKMMKYAVNHPFKFNSCAMAWFCGFMQMTSTLGVELSNIGVILGANDTISIVFNFIAVAIIAEFDNYVFDSLTAEPLKCIVEKRFTVPAFPIIHTSSKKCNPEEVGRIKDPQGKRYRLKISMNERSWTNITMFIVYKILRAFYVSMFYYFLPFTTIILSTLLPTLRRGPEQFRGCRPYD